MQMQGKCFELLKTKQTASPSEEDCLISSLARLITEPTLWSFSRYLVMYLEFQFLGLLPSETLVAEMPILGCPAVDRIDEIKLLDNDTGSEIEVLVDDLNQFLAASVASSVCLHEQARWLGNANGVGKLYECSSRQFGIDQRLGYPSG